MNGLAGMVADIVNDAGADIDAISDADLGRITNAFAAASIALGASLGHRCGNLERASRQIGLAMDLPSSVLRRRAKEAEAIIGRDEVPSVEQHAAFVAVVLKHITNINALMERRAAGVPLQ